MKKILFIPFFTVFFLCAQAQHVDGYKFIMDFSAGVLPVNISGTLDIGHSGETYIGSHGITEFPIYRRVDTIAVVLAPLVHIGANLPFYRANDWSIGLKINAGMGYHYGVRASEGLTALVFDFPQYLYYRNYKNRLDFSVLAGYKFTYAALNFHLAMAAFDFNIDDISTVRVYGSVSRYKYYRMLTDGTLEPMVQFAECGVAYVLNF